MEKTQDKEKLSQDGQKKDTENKPLTKEDLKIGEIRIGDTLKKVKEIYGEPSEKTIVHGQGAPQWNYESQGLSFLGETIWAINAYDSFKGSTSRGIKNGDSIEKVKKAYPDVYTYPAYKSHDFLVQKDGDYSITFDTENGIVIGISVSKDLE